MPPQIFRRAAIHFMTLRSLILLAALIFGEVLWSLVPALRGWWPHLALVWFVIAAAHVESGPLIVLAGVVGLIEDVLFGSPFGVHPLGLITVAAAARRWHHHLLPDQRLNVAVYVFLYAAAETALLGLVAGGPAGLWHGLSLRGALAAAAIAALAPQKLDRLFGRPFSSAAVRIAPVK